MKEKTKQVFYCDFCGKSYFIAAFAAQHETYCRNNPKNKHQCFKDCRFLKRETQSFEFINVESDGEFICEGFTCTKLNISLHSYKAESKANSPKSIYRDCFAHIVSKTTRMPLTCSSFQEETASMPF